MKKSIIIILGAVIIASLIGGCNQTTSTANQGNSKNTDIVSTTEDNNVTYKDGTYEGKYADGTEGYYCIAKVTIENNKITNVDWNIYDKSNRVFDDKYEDVFDNEGYKKQCRDDLKGSKAYAPTLVDKQDIQKVDAISGATWTNNFFKGAVKQALNKAK